MSAPCSMPPGMHGLFTRLRLVSLGADREPNAPLDQVSGLLVRMRMAWQDSAFAQVKLRHQGFCAVNEGLPFDPLQRWNETFITFMLEHSPRRRYRCPG